MDVRGTKAASTEPDDKAASDPRWRTDYERFVPWFISNVFSEPDSQRTIDEVVAIALEADHPMLVQQATELDWDQAPRRLQELTCPALVVHGTDDRTLDLNSVKAVAAAIPNAKLQLLDSLGHRPDIRRPDIVNPIFAEFLRTDAAEGL
jgi:pimeloyl-ACP methyl ester carboxylesterase